MQRRDGGLQGESAGVATAERSQDQVVRLGDRLPDRTVVLFLPVLEVVASTNSKPAGMVPPA
ncbi:hypothetical protein [Pseudonocardia sp.]|jgi:hypothetical protein|uniref:hypothetical protein n=1 Tax=Pseudonocardia sp. TaxID=60912 RepID=UPI002DA6CC49|nr:hypothetical protein [Pseudonocardia sp.]